MTIKDLDGRLAINELVQNNNPHALMVDRFFRLFTALGVDHLADPAELTAALIDWLDSGDEAYQQIQTDGLNIPVAGAEDAYYQGQQAAYPCKNGPLETLEELLLVKGFSKEVLTIVGPHLAVNGSTKININTASDMVLMSLDAVITEQVAEMIIAYRQDSPIVAISELEKLLPATAYSALKSLSNQKFLGTTSSIYQLTAHARVNDGSRVLRAEVDKTGNKLLFIKVD